LTFIFLFVWADCNGATWIIKEQYSSNFAGVHFSTLLLSNNSIGTDQHFIGFTLIMSLAADALFSCLDEGHH